MKKKKTFFFKIISIFLILFISSFQIKAQEKPEVFSCGTEADPDAYTSDLFYGDNQKLVDLLIENNVNIDRDYLKQLESGKDISTMGREMFNSESYQYAIPIKAWVYRNNNGTGNFNQNEIHQVIDNLNILYASYNINFYLLCDISFINNSNYANYGADNFYDYTLNNKLEKALNIHFVIHSGSSWSGKANPPFLSFVGGINPRAFSCAVTFSNVNTTAKVLGHEIGHTLGLYHTHHPGRSSGTNGQCGNCYQEAVSRSRKQGVLCISTIGKKNVK